MASAPRAVGRIVVWVDEAAETATVSSSTEVRIAPNTGSPTMVSTSSAFSSLPSPMPSSAKPANAPIAYATSR